ncbi:MAG TPA: FUSC family membrane protein [Puia sp.]|nr:FUSC family membrane protein [Puia sp.]
MDYRTTFRSFINSHYLSEGIRITVGLTLPAIVGSYLNHESAGIAMSLGASCVIMVDHAGPVHHRRNAMIACNAAIFLIALFMGLVSVSPLITGILIAVCCFIFSMGGVYGARAGSVGLAALFVMVLSLEDRLHSWEILYNAIYILAGGIWYMLFSLSLYGFRPYRVTQQALGDCIQATAGYLRQRAAFYGTDPDYDAIYSALLSMQVDIHEKQNLIREMILKSRDIVKESTNTGRVILLMFLDTIDLFEQVMSSQPDFRLLHAHFDRSGMLERFHQLLLSVSDELNETGIAIKSAKAMTINNHLDSMLRDLKNNFDRLRDDERDASNVEAFIAMRNVLNGLEEMISRIHTIQQYSSYDLKESKRAATEADYDRFVTHQDIDGKVLLNNFNWKSNSFRHALRVTVATTVGYIVSRFFPFGHSYWILLTIIVILKPNYSLTKKRNYDRLIGTIIGAGIGALILFLIPNQHVVFGIMILLMILAYSFMRRKYLVFVMLMTPYILILFHLLNPVHFRVVIGDRLLDTAIGSGIAFLANLLIAPAWVQETFSEYFVRMIRATKHYFHDVATAFTGVTVDINEYKYSRKTAYVELANITDALNRMLTEPKRKQKNPAVFHQFVVLNYMMISHIATLASYWRGGMPVPADADYQPVIDAIEANLTRAEIRLQSDSLLLAGPAEENVKARPEPASAETTVKAALRKINDRVNTMVDQRKAELEQGIEDSVIRRRLTLVKAINDQFNFISKISFDIIKIVDRVDDR